MELVVFWLFVAVFVIRKWHKDAKQASQAERTRFVQQSIQRICSIWDVDSLKSVMYQEIGKFPEYEAYLSQAYAEQMQLLNGLKKGRFQAKEKIAKEISAKLSQCHSYQSLESLKKQFEWVLKVAPDLNKLFENRHHKLLLNKMKNRKSNLFSQCRSVDEVKKRFRRLAFLNHPDRGGNSAAMSEIIRQYEEILQNKDQLRR